MTRGFRSPALLNYDVENYGGRDPSRGVRLIRPPDQEPEALSESQFDHLLRMTQDPVDRAILATLGCTGARAGELLNLEVQDVQLRKGQGSIYVRHASFYSPGSSKKSAARHLPVWPLYGAFLQDFVARVRWKNVPDGCIYLFAKSDGAPFSARGLHSIVSRCLKAAGIETRQQGPHMLRRTCACILFDHGFGLAEIALHLGHSESTGVQVLLKHYLTKDRRERAAHVRPGQRDEDPFCNIKSLRVRPR